MLKKSLKPDEVMADRYAVRFKSKTNLAYPAGKAELAGGRPNLDPSGAAPISAQRSKAGFCGKKNLAKRRPYRSRLGHGAGEFVGDIRWGCGT